MPERYEDYPRIAIITGADSGIGKACAVALAEAGFHVGITWHLDVKGADRTAEEVRATGRRCEIAELDLTRLPGAAAVVDELADRLGGIGVLVNNAGTGLSTPFVDVSWEQWREVLSVDLDGPFLCSQRAARRMRSAGKGGRIINITSVHEHVDPFTQERPGVPVRRPGDAREVAAVVALLAARSAAYVTGASWPVDGGMLMMGPQASALPDHDWRSV